MFILAMADGRKGEGLSVGVVCRDKFGEWVKMQGIDIREAQRMMKVSKELPK